MMLLPSLPTQWSRESSRRSVFAPAAADRLSQLLDVLDRKVIPISPQSFCTGADSPQRRCAESVDNPPLQLHIQIQSLKRVNYSQFCGPFADAADMLPLAGQGKEVV